MGLYTGSSFALLSDEEGEVDVSRLVGKARLMEQEKKDRILMEAIEIRKAQLGISRLEYEENDDTSGEDEDDGSDEEVAQASINTINTSKIKAKAKDSAKKSKKKDESNDKKIRKSNIDEYSNRKPVVEDDQKKLRSVFKPMAWRNIKMLVMVSIMVAILMAMLRDKNEIEIM